MMAVRTGFDPVSPDRQSGIIASIRTDRMAPRTGLEPATCDLEGRCSCPIELTGHKWWTMLDLNQRPAGYEPDALTN